MTLISTRVSACDFVVKFSISVCIAVVAYLTGEKWLHNVLLTLSMEQQTVTNPAVIHGLCAMTKH